MATTYFYRRHRPSLKARTVWVESSDRQNYNWLELADGAGRMTAAERQGETPLPVEARIKPDIVS